MACHDCNRPYGAEHGFPDLIIPFWAWVKISPSGDDSGLLCPSCICKRLHVAGIRCEGAFMSGPIISVDQVTMSNLRRVENIEPAIDGRDNRWNLVRELIATAKVGGAPERLAMIERANARLAELFGPDEDDVSRLGRATGAHPFT